jgi:hypothetical protein
MPSFQALYKSPIVCSASSRNASSRAGSGGEEGSAALKEKSGTASRGLERGRLEASCREEALRLSAAVEELEGGCPARSAAVKELEGGCPTRWERLAGDAERQGRQGGKRRRGRVPNWMVSRS